MNGYNSYINNRGAYGSIRRAEGSSEAATRRVLPFNDMADGKKMTTNTKFRRETVAEQNNIQNRYPTRHLEERHIQNAINCGASSNVINEKQRSHNTADLSLLMNEAILLDSVEGRGLTSTVLSSSSSSATPSSCRSSGGRLRENKFEIPRLEEGGEKKQSFFTSQQSSQQQGCLNMIDCESLAAESTTGFFLVLFLMRVLRT